MQKVYSTLNKSVIRAMQELIKDIKSTMSNQGELRYWSWESRMDEDRMPNVPLIGVNGFSFDENSDLWIVRFGVTISTVDDAHLHDEADMIDIVHEHFGEGKKILLRNPTDGSVMNELVSVDFEVMPMVQTQVRNYRSIGVEVRRTGTD